MTPHRTMQKIVVIALAALIVVLAAAYAAYTFIPAVRETIRPIQVLIVNASVPEDIKDAYFLHTEGEVTKTYTREGGVFASVEESDPIISEDMMTGTHARILRSGSSEFAVIVNDAVITSSREGKLGVSVSEDGAYVAYAEVRPEQDMRSLPAELLPLFDFSPSDWTIVVHDIAAATTTVSFPGILPVFVDERRVLFVREDGIYVRDIRDGVEQHIIARPMVRVGAAPLVSPDGSLFAVRDASLRRIEIYRTDIAPGRLQYVSSVSAPGGVVSYSLGNDSVYTLRKVNQTFEVWSHAFTGGTSERVFMLPPDIAVDRMHMGIL